MSGNREFREKREKKTYFCKIITVPSCDEAMKRCPTKKKITTILIFFLKSTVRESKGIERKYKKSRFFQKDTHNHIHKRREFIYYKNLKRRRHEEDIPVRDASRKDVSATYFHTYSTESTSVYV